MSEIYVVEDDDAIRELVMYALNASGFRASGFAGAAAFREALRRSRPVLVLLDIMLPVKDGLSLLREIREEPSTRELPVILLSARTGEFDRVKGLDLGADDYIGKPFSVLELISRVRAVLRRSGDPAPQARDELSFGKVVLSVSRRSVKVDGEDVALTYKEFELLRLLLENEGYVLTRNRIMSAIWDTDFEGETRTVDMHVKTLRQKLGEEGRIVKTVRSVGYKIGE